MNRLKFSTRLAAHIAVIIGAFTMCILTISAAQAFTSISPGASTVLSAQDELKCQESAVGPDSGDGFPVTATCRTETQGGASRHLDVNAFTGFTTGNLPNGQRAIATAQLINEIQIPASTGGGLKVLRTQIATEVSWSGILFAAGVNTTSTQVVATLQVRDTVTGEVIASNTFLFERLDAKLALDVIDAIDGVDITNSTGADITAFLVRGRTYAIEVEAKCDMSVPLLGAAVCSFYDANTDIPGAGPLVNGDGFDVGNITVSVDDDPIEALFR